VSPYCQPDPNEQDPKHKLQMRIFHNDDEEEALPYELDYFILPQSTIPKASLDSIYQLCEGSAKDGSATDYRDEWFQGIKKG